MKNKNYFKFLMLSILCSILLISGVSALNTTNLSSYWTFDDNSSIVIDNISGNNLALSGDVSSGSAGILGDALLKGAGSGYAINTSAINLPIDLDYTLNYWEYRTGGTSNAGGLGWGSGSWDDFQTSFGSDGSTYKGFMGASGGYAFDTGYVLVFDEWRMITWVYEESTQNISFYINGTYVSSANLEDRAVGGVISFGSEPSSTIYSFQGYLDEASLWNKTLSTSELSELFNSGNAYNGFLLPPVEINYNLTECNSSMNFVAGGQYVLQNNLSTEDLYCFDIDADNVSFDLNGYSINASLYFNEQYDATFKNNGGIVKMLGIYAGELSSNWLSLSNDFIYVDAGVISVPANITFSGLPTNFSNPVILRDGIECLDCINYTDLNDGTVQFYVTGFSNYTIGENITLPVPVVPPQFTETGQAIYEIMDSSGAGLGMFFGFMGASLPLLLIGLALVGIIVMIGFAIKKYLIEGGSP